VPPETYVTEQQEDLEENRSREVRGALLRSFGVLVTSFVLVFIAAHVLVTWPLWPTRIGFYLSELGQGSVTEATASVVEVTPDNDSDKDGYSDAEELAFGYDPHDAGPVKLDSDKDGLKDTLERDRYGTDPLKSDSDGDGYNDYEEITSGYSPLRPADYDAWVAEKTSATLRIPRIDVEVPVVWTTDVENIYEDLKKGISHYPGTVDPGEKGRSIMSGHSSSLAWDWNSFSTAFVLLDQLDAGDKIEVDYMGMTYTYEVAEQIVTDPEDTSNFAPTPEATLTLLTCSPVGSVKDRRYVNSILVSAQPIDR